jgi:Replication factor C C-terminal domain
VGAVSVKEDADEDAMDIDEKECKMVTVKSIEDIAGVIPDETIEKLVQAMQPNSKGLTYEAVAKVVTDMVADGWSGTQVVSQVCSSRNKMQLKLIQSSFSNQLSIMSRFPTYRRTRSLSSSPKRTNASWTVLMSTLLFWISPCEYRIP